MQEQTFIVYLTAGPGIYGHDSDGAACGAPICRGWSRGKLGDETHYCSDHIVVIGKGAAQ